MLSRKSFNEKNIIFSCLSGYNFYLPKNETPDFSKNLGGPAVNWETGNEVIIQYESMLTEKTIDKWRYYIENPADVYYINWPVDIVKINRKYAFVYRNISYADLVPLKDLLFTPNVLDWHDKKIQRLIINILECFKDLHSKDYSYHSFDMEHMYYNKKDMSFYIDFSLAIARNNGSSYKTEEVSSNLNSIELLPMWQKPKEDNLLCLIDDLNSLAIIIFRLMIGRLPYEGNCMYDVRPIMNKEIDDSPTIYNVSLMRYRSGFAFIFDPNDKSNMIGSFLSEKKFVDRFNSLSDGLKQMFIKTFEKENIDKPLEEKVAYTAQQWLDAIKKAWKE